MDERAFVLGAVPLLTLPFFGGPPWLLPRLGMALGEGVARPLQLGVTPPFLMPLRVVAVALRQPRATPERQRTRPSAPP